MDDEISSPESPPPLVRKSKRTKSIPVRPGYRGAGTSRAATPVPPPPAPTSEYSRYFPGDTRQQKEFATTLIHREILAPKYMDTEFFEEHQFEIVQTLRAVQLLGFAELKCSYAPIMVKAFYQNLKFTSGPSLLTTSIKGVDIAVRADDWGDIIGYRAEGAAVFDGSDYREFDGYRRDDFVRDIARPGMLTPSKFSSTHLTIAGRVLHYLITHTIMPRASNHGIVLNADLFIMWAIMTRAPIHWTDTFCRVMMTAKRSRSGMLPYPLLIQRIMELKGVSMAHETLTPLKGNHRFGSLILKKAGLHMVDGVWRWDDPVGAAAAAAVVEDDLDAGHDGDEIAHMDEDPQHAPATADAATTSAAPHTTDSAGSTSSMADILAAMTLMRTTVSDGFDRMDSRFASIDTRLTAIDTRFAEQTTFIRELDTHTQRNLVRMHTYLSDIGDRLDDIEDYVGIERDSPTGPPSPPLTWPRPLPPQP